MKAFLLYILPKIARFHPSNKSHQDYPQLWYCMPRRWKEGKGFYPNGQRKLKRARLRLCIEWLCGKLTGHEISRTEKGYGGGTHIDCNCRWCDKSIKIPVKENVLSKEFISLMGKVEKDR